MNGILKDKLVSSLNEIQNKLCGYVARTRCDCKYFPDKKDHKTSEATGCPEVSMAVALISAMTPAEFNELRKRAGISIFELDAAEQLLGLK
jgi:hypothetical protein